VVRITFVNLKFNRRERELMAFFISDDDVLILPDWSSVLGLEESPQGREKVVALICDLSIIICLARSV
jgi:hypothetical protein